VAFLLIKDILICKLQAILSWHFICFLHPQATNSTLFLYFIAFNIIFEISTTWIELLVIFALIGNLWGMLWDYSSYEKSKEGFKIDVQSAF
jgi:hypothetical protein